jgi:hypothetical protein
MTLMSAETVPTIRLMTVVLLRHALEKVDVV